LGSSLFNGAHSSSSAASVNSPSDFSLVAYACSPKVIRPVLNLSDSFSLEMAILASFFGESPYSWECSKDIACLRGGIRVTKSYFLANSG
jgi:hypothetical protein